jgi:hypothetical protein
MINEKMGRRKKGSTSEAGKSQQSSSTDMECEQGKHFGSSIKYAACRSLCTPMQRGRSEVAEFYGAVFQEHVFGLLCLRRKSDVKMRSRSTRATLRSPPHLQISVKNPLVVTVAKCLDGLCKIHLGIAYSQSRRAGRHYHLQHICVTQIKDSKSRSRRVFNGPPETNDVRVSLDSSQCANLDASITIFS